LTVLVLALQALSKEGLFVVMRRKLASLAQLVVSLARGEFERVAAGTRLDFLQEDPIASFPE
jgi:hypothetical protein